jgi:hypothetical protein
MLALQREVRIGFDPLLGEPMRTQIFLAAVFALVIGNSADAQGPQSNYNLARKETVGYQIIDPICRVMKVKTPIC